MTTVRLGFSIDAEAGWNMTRYDPQVAGVSFSNMLDSTGAPTGLNYVIVVPLVRLFGSGTLADADAHGIPQSVWKNSNRFDDAGEAMITGFVPGQVGTALMAGHSNSATRDANFVLNGGAPVLYDATVKPPAAPVEVPFIADASGNVSIKALQVSDRSYLNFIILNYTVSTTPTITDIDQLIEGETSTITYSAPFPQTSLTITDGVTSKTVTSFSGSGSSYTFTCPPLTVGETGLKLGDVTITSTDGTDTTNGFVSEYTKSGYSSVILDDVSADNYRQGTEPQLETGSQVIFPSAISVDTSGIHSGDIAGEYLIYDISLVDQIVRSFTLNYVPSGEDAPPVMPADRTVTVYDGAVTLGIFPASSGTPPITYAIGGADAALFTINTATAKVDPVGALTIGQSGVITVTPENSAGVGGPQTINWSVIAVPDVVPPGSLSMRSPAMEGIIMRPITMRGI